MRGCGLAGGAGALCINGRNVPSIAVAHSAALVSCGLSTTVTAGYMYRAIVLHVLLPYTFYSVLHVLWPAGYRVMALNTL